MSAHQDKRQSDRARAYLVLTTLTSGISASDFIETLADVATVNSRYSLSRGHGRRERDAWLRFAEQLQAYLDSNNLPTANNPS